MPVAASEPAPHLWVWMDLEMTGLDPVHDQMIEVAVLISDAELQVRASGPELVISAPQTRLDSMDSWNQEHHLRSGLLERVRTSKLSLGDAEQQILSFLRLHCIPQTAHLVGNSIWQDRRFLATQMPELERFFHYRMIDVTALKLALTAWLPAAPPFAKQNRHRALEDIHESLAEMGHYRDLICGVQAQ